MQRTLSAILVASFPIAFIPFIHSTKVNEANNEFEKTLISPTPASTLSSDTCKSKLEDYP